MMGIDPFLWIGITNPYPFPDPDPPFVIRSFAHPDPRFRTRSGSVRRSCSSLHPI